MPRVVEPIWLYGANHAAFHCKQHEYIVDGPADTGKSWGCLKRINLQCMLNPGARMLIVRQRQVDLRDSVIPMLEDKIFTDENYPVKPIGGENVFRFRYSNRSLIVCCGLDKPGKALSSEYDWVFVNQAEQIRLGGWETLLTRANGRRGGTPFPLVFGDCNPDIPQHWIRERAKLGFLKLFRARHRDNPTIYDPGTGQLTPGGKIRMEILNRLTGIRRKRLLKGIWCGTEGIVYPEWDEAVNIIPRTRMPLAGDWWVSIDFGYTNPFSLGLYRVDYDGRIFLTDEIYFTKRTMKRHCRDIVKMIQGKDIKGWICDHDALARATLVEEMAELGYRIKTIPADKAVETGIEAHRERIKPSGDGLPRFFVCEGAIKETDPDLRTARKPVCTIDEYLSYSYAEGKDGRPIKEEPIKEDDHSMDRDRYLTMHFDSPHKQRVGVLTSENDAYTGVDVWSEY